MTESGTKPFLILDRDGTIIELKAYLSEPRDVVLLPGAARGLQHLTSQGYGLIVITNQSGIGRGYFDETQLKSVHQRMIDLLSNEGVTLDRIYYCPHTPDDHCLCRKPHPALLLEACAEFQFDPAHCFVIGDNRCDIELGNAVGATTLLVRTGYGAELERELNLPPCLVANDLVEAAQLIESISNTRSM
jgi:D-glycero-D-manno-heptose 1,7-bisphosphate phosphatase